MSIRLALQRGLRVVNRSKRLWFIFYAAVTIAAVLPAAALMTIAFQSLGHSTWAGQLGRSLDLEWIGELMAAYGNLPIQPVLAVSIGVVAVSLIVHLLLLGGALDLFAKRQWFSAAVFFGGCGRNFWRLFRLAIYCLIPLAVVVGINMGLAAIGNKIWGDGSEATPLIHWSWLRAAVIVLLLGLVNLIYDYTAIQLVADDSRKAFRGMWRSFRFLWRNFGRVAGLATVLWCLVVVMLGVYFAISQLFPQHTLLGVLALLVVRQVLVVGRMWWRLVFYASQCEMYEGLSASPGLAESLPAELGAHEG